MFSALSKHWTVLKAAWREENENRKSRRRHKEHAFLPAALEIMEKPPSPIGRAILWTIMAFFTIAVLWAVFGRVDVVATAAGKILPRERVKVIQAPDVGVVRAVYVTDGDRVAAGDVLIDFDPTNAAAEQVQAREQLGIAEIDLARGEALLAFILGGEPRFADDGVDPAVAARQRALIDAQIAEYKARQAALIKQRDERTADLAVIDSQISKLRETLPMVREQVTAREELLEQGYAARLMVLEVKERQVSMEKDLQIAGDQRRKAEASIEAANRELDQLREEFRKTVLAELAEAEARARLAREDLNKADLRRDLQSLKAPVDGVVQQLSVYTVGAVVKPADPLLVVVPGEGELVVDAMILNKDIGFVEEGDAVEVKLEAFPFTKYGVIDGVLEDISNDAIQDENLGLVYQGRVKLARQTIRIDGRDIALSPGMASTVEIKTGTRRIIEFLLSPLLRYRDEALRER
ncbi:HlyD family type I secretion periplasmic adaptor subunit [Hyphococcus luteus]|uniref:Membrane fusion protein (MFP) family protein n=1 Tax=Hyphococcus luteus TaxID=2058213 RepID=A0A2S7K4V7_9PROT|nr:HlyD family type I secretion periplasmic adaptor subunit [Marinicaulis flavus]PQA87545.1 HlyD family type I secretion periplasmic adaptor subunit [Marinicaulis flavus]